MRRTPKRSPPARKKVRNWEIPLARHWQVAPKVTDEERHAADIARWTETKGAIEDRGPGSAEETAEDMEVGLGGDDDTYQPLSSSLFSAAVPAKIYADILSEALYSPWNTQTILLAISEKENQRRAMRNGIHIPAELLPEAKKLEEILKEPAKKTDPGHRGRV